MEALAMLALIVLALIIGWLVKSLLFHRKWGKHWQNEASEWKKQVYDEHTRQG